MQTLTIPISTEPTSKPSSPNSIDVMNALLSSGFDEVDLTGLAQIKAQLRDGSAVDYMPLRTEEDAAFLIEGWQSAEKWGLRSPPSGPHHAYLEDGCFEISAIPMRGDVVLIRAGEFRSEEDWLERAAESAATMTVEEYIYLWRSIARCLLEGLPSALRARLSAKRTSQH